jgi:uncharacterized lipoprotein YddW (UPF0748 family)
MHPGTHIFQDIVRISHKHNLRVIPWFEYGFMVPRNSAIVAKNPDWLTTDGTESWGKAPDWQLIFQGDQQAVQNWLQRQNVWLNPFHRSIVPAIPPRIIATRQSIQPRMGPLATPSN